MEILVEKTGKQLVNELAHTMSFLDSMGFNTTDLTIAQVTSLKAIILEGVIKEVGEPTQEVKNAF